MAGQTCLLWCEQKERMGDSWCWCWCWLETSIHGASPWATVPHRAYYCLPLAGIIGFVACLVLWGQHTLYQPICDCLKNAGPPCRMIFWVILSLILAGFCFLRAGTDRPKCLKIDILCGFLSDFAMYTFWKTCHKLYNMSNCLILKCFMFTMPSDVTIRSAMHKNNLFELKLSVFTNKFL